MDESLAPLHETLALARQEVGKVIIGQNEMVEHALIAIFAGKHCLVEGVPGIAKTLLVRTLAHLLGCTFHRIQFTADLDPTDIIGANVFNPKLGEFQLIKGPVFTTFLLADEINRAPARTQSALLQAMQEHQVTIDRHTYELSPNFCVFATENPIESEGVFPLPEAQKDRFMIKVHMGCPNEDDEVKLAERTLTKDAPEALIDRGVIRPILTAERLSQLRDSLESVRVRAEMVRYVVALVRLTRNHAAIKVGAGPRATQSLILSSRVRAAIHGRTEVLVEDVRAMTLACLEHRIILKPEFVEKGLTCTEAVQHVLQSVRPPK